MKRAPLLAVAAAASLSLAGCGGSSSNSAMDETTKDYIGYDACKGAVEEQLKAPGSADFQSRFSVDYRTKGGDSLMVIGWVDAQNSFGAKLRSNFTCTMDVDKKGTVSDVQAELDGQ